MIRTHSESGFVSVTSLRTGSKVIIYTLRTGSKVIIYNNKCVTSWVPTTPINYPAYTTGRQSKKLGAIHKGRSAKIEIFRPPVPRLSGVVRKLAPPPPSDVRLFDFPWYENHYMNMFISDLVTRLTIAGVPLQRRGLLTILNSMISLWDRRR